MKIFLSYASEDRAKAESIKLALTGEGIKVFFGQDSLPATGGYHSQIREAIEECDAFIFLVSPHSIQEGKYTLSELKFAREKWMHPKGKVMPVFLAPTDWDGIPEYLKAAIFLQPVGNVAAEVVAEIQKLYSKGEKIQSMLRIYGGRWVGGGAFALMTEEKVRLAKIIDSKNAENIGVFYGASCAFMCDVEALLEWVNIVEIIVQVHDFKPLPNYESIYQLPFETAHVYYAEIDDPVKVKRNQFSFKYFYDQSKKYTMGVLRLKAGIPEHLVLQINAKTPGIYTFDLVFIANYREKNLHIPIAKDNQFLFEES